VARAAPPGEQHRDRRDPQDPRPEHLQEGPRQDPRQVQGHRLGPEPDLQEALRRTSSARPAASPTAASSATTTSTTRRRTSSCSGMAQIAAAAHAPFIAAAAPTCHEHGVVAGALQPARPHQDLPERRVRALAQPPRERRRPLRRPGHAPLPVPPSLRRQDQPGRGVRLRGRHRPGADTSKYTWSNAAYAMAVNINRSFKPTAGAPASAASSRAAWSRASPATPSPPTTAAWT
jgi:hypothetical protein